MAARASVPPKSTERQEAERDLSPLEERIRRRAYEIYVEGGRLDGSALDHWLRAKDEILAAEGAIDEASEESFPASDPPAR